MNNKIPYAYIENGKFTYSISELERVFPFKQEMENCPQSPRWHKEGNAWIHTMMVLDNLINSQEYKDLSPEDQQIMFYATLFNDIGKPKTTIFENGDYSSKKHSYVGSQMTRWFFMENPVVNFKAREEIANLVYLHMTPPRIMERSDPQEYVIKSSYAVRNNLLHLLSTCDTNGRISENNDEEKRNALERLEFFKLMCEDNKCFKDEFSFYFDEYTGNYLNNKCRYAYLNEGKKFLLGDPSLGMYSGCAEGVVMCGVPGAGKDHAIKTHYNRHNVVGMDIARAQLNSKHGEAEGEAYQLTLKMAKEIMKDKLPIVINATNTHKLSRKKWIELLVAYKYEVKIHYVERPIETILKQNGGRERVVPEDYIISKLKKIDVPLKAECHEIFYDVV